MKRDVVVDYKSTQTKHLKKIEDLGTLPAQAYELALQVFRLCYPHDHYSADLFWDNDPEKIGFGGVRAIFRAEFWPGGPSVYHKGIITSAKFVVEIVLLRNNPTQPVGRQETALVRWGGTSGFPRFDGDYEMKGETIVYLS